MMPPTPLLFGGSLHLSQNSGDGIIRKSFPVHLEDGAKDLLFALMVDHFSGQTPLTEWQVMDPILRATGLLQGDSETDQASRIAVLEDANSVAICLKERLSSTYFRWRTALLKVTDPVLILDWITVFAWRTFPVPGSERSTIRGAGTPNA